jgi:hypothetical protein
MALDIVAVFQKLQLLVLDNPVDGVNKVSLTEKLIFELLYLQNT